MVMIFSFSPLLVPIPDPLLPPACCSPEDDEPALEELELEEDARYPKCSFFTCAPVPNVTVRLSVEVVT